MNELLTCSMQLSGENWKSKSVGEFIIEARLNITFFWKYVGILSQTTVAGISSFYPKT